MRFLGGAQPLEVAAVDLDDDPAPDVVAADSGSAAAAALLNRAVPTPGDLAVQLVSPGSGVAATGRPFPSPRPQSTSAPLPTSQTAFVLSLDPALVRPIALTGTRAVPALAPGAWTRRTTMVTAPVGNPPGGAPSGSTRTAARR